MNLRVTIQSTAALALLLSATAATATIVPFSPLPAGTMTLIPKQAPKHVAFGDRVPGLFVAQAPVPKSNGNYKRIEILDSKSDAAEFASKGYVSSRSGAVTESKSCVFYADEASIPGDNWPALARGELSAFAGSEQNPIVGVHVETLDDGTKSGKPPALGIVDAWLDTRTRGLRLVARNTIPLGKVAEGPFGIRVLAARGDDSVHFVVLPPPPAQDRPGVSGEVERAIIESGGEIGVSQCQHSRVSLRALPGTGEKAIVSFQHVERAPREAADPEPSNDIDGAALVTTRVRLVQVHLSASRNSASSSTNAPVVSVSFRVDKPKPLGS